MSVAQALGWALTSSIVGVLLGFVYGLGVGRSIERSGKQKVEGTNRVV